MSIRLLDKILLRSAAATGVATMLRVTPLSNKVSMPMRGGCKPSPALNLVWQCYAYSQYKVQQRNAIFPFENGPL